MTLTPNRHIIYLHVKYLRTRIWSCDRLIRSPIVNRVGNDATLTKTGKTGRTGLEVAIPARDDPMRFVWSFNFTFPPVSLQINKQSSLKFLFYQRFPRKCHICFLPSRSSTLIQNSKSKMKSCWRTYEETNSELFALV